MNPTRAARRQRRRAVARERRRTARTAGAEASSEDEQDLTGARVRAINLAHEVNKQIGTVVSMLEGRIQVLDLRQLGKN